MKVLHCPTTVGGNPQGLCRAERALGLKSRSLALGSNYLAYAVDEMVGGRGGRLGRELSRWTTIRRALKEYDVIHYNFGSTLAPLRAPEGTNSWGRWFPRAYNRIYAGPLEMVDLRWARERGLVTAITYQGDDARQGDFCRRHYPLHFVHEVAEGYYSDDTDRYKRERIEKAEKWADLIYAVNPDLFRVLPSRARFMPYASVDPRDWRPSPDRGEPSSRPCVVHAPSHRAVKGTRYVLSACERLRAEGVNFELVLVENMANAEARKVYARADLAVDQLLAGFYGGLAVELMALEVPVLAYINRGDMTFLPPAMAVDLPLIQATPDTVYAVLREWLTTRRLELRARGRESRRFVERWHDPLLIARGVAEDYRRVRTTREDQVCV